MNALSWERNLGRCLRKSRPASGSTSFLATKQVKLLNLTLNRPRSRLGVNRLYDIGSVYNVKVYPQSVA